MADLFDKDAAGERHRAIINEVEGIRDGLTRDVINYYYSDPASEDDEKTKRDGMRKYLKIASDEIYNLLNGRLN
jgi:hypothetical protein